MTACKNTCPAAYASAYIGTAGRAAVAKRPVTLKSVGVAAVWYFDEQDTLVARPATTVAPCGCCDTVYRVEALLPLPYDLWEHAVKDFSFEADAALCPMCRKAFQTKYGGLIKEDVYHVLDRGIDPQD